MKSRHPLKILFLVLILLFTGSPVKGQEKMNIAIGVGIPELVNLALRFQQGQSQLGLYGGTVPGSDNEVLTVGVDYYYHFKGSSNFSARRPWYVKAGLNYFQDETPYNRNTYLILVPRLGRDFNFSGRMGIALEGGILLLLSHSEEKIKLRESPCWLCGGSIYPDIGPSLGLSLFYRL